MCIKEYFSLHNLSFCYCLGSSLLDPGDRTASRSSLDSHDAVQTESGILEKITRVCVNIVRGTNSNESETVVDAPVEQQNETDEVETEENQKEQINTSQTQPESPSEYLRLLSRSESAGDANIIDKLQQNTKKNCARSLHFNGDKEEEMQNEKTSPTK